VNEVRGKIVTTPSKTKGSRRVVSISAFLVEMLAEEVKGRSAKDYVFTSPGGGPLRRNAFRSRFWIPATIAAGLPHQFTRERGEPVCLCGLAEDAPSHQQPVRFHDLRHSHAAMLIGQGVHAKAIADRLGHASIRTTMDTYGHLLEGIDQGAAEGLDALYRAAEPKPAAVVEIGGRS
jgi:integrase